MGNQLISLKNVPFYQGEYVLPIYLFIIYLPISVYKHIYSKYYRILDYVLYVSEWCKNNNQVLIKYERILGGMTEAFP